MSERLIVASNRLPIVLSQEPAGDWTLTPGSGGLVTALDPVLRSRGGLWIGWPGTDDRRREDVDEVLAQARPNAGYGLKGVHLTARERDDFYLGFSNQVIWPLFHDFQTECNFEPRFWASYHAVNQKFAEAIAAFNRAEQILGPGDRALEEGALLCPCAQVYPMRDCADAHEAVRTGDRTGAILLDCS